MQKTDEKILTLLVRVTHKYSLLSFCFMARNHTCKFKVSEAQLERIRLDAQARGYVRIAPYLRDLALEKSRVVEDQIHETNQLVKKIWETLK